MRFPPLIIRRLDAALEGLRAQGAEPRYLALTRRDADAYNRLRSRQWGGPVVCLAYADVPIMRAEGRSSQAIAKCGQSVIMPTRIRKARP